MIDSCALYSGWYLQASLTDDGNLRLDLADNSNRVSQSYTLTPSEARVVECVAMLMAGVAREHTHRLQICLQQAQRELAQEMSRRAASLEPAPAKPRTKRGRRAK